MGEIVATGGDLNKNFLPKPGEVTNCEKKKRVRGDIGGHPRPRRKKTEDVDSSSQHGGT